jgi:hypothetical protein
MHVCITVRSSRCILRVIIIWSPQVTQVIYLIKLQQASVHDNGLNKRN